MRAAGLALGLALVAGFVQAPVAAQDRGDDRARAVPGGVYRRPLGNEPATLDPARIGDIYGFSVTQQIFDGLVHFDRTLTLAPALARHWTASRDGLTWTFTLRKGVRFHHGREVTAEDVVYSLTRLLAPQLKSGPAELLGSIRGARQFREGAAPAVSGLMALDRHTVQILLEEPYANFVSVLAVGHAKILPRELVEQQGEAFGTQPVGTGPFKFVRWDRGKEIVLAVNPDYFEGPPRLARVVYTIFKGEPVDAIYREFEQGRLEDSPVPLPIRERAAEEGRFQYIRRPMFSVRLYGLNARLKPFDDVRVRRALAHTLDRRAILDEIFQGRYHPARGVLPPGTPGFNPQLRPVDHDPARARELLRAAGFGPGREFPPLTIWSSVRSERLVREHEVVRRNLAEVGVRADFHYETNWPAFFRAVTEGKPAMFLWAWYADVPDPDNFLFKLFHSRSTRNVFGYVNPVVDDLLERARTARDPQRRVELYRRAEQLVVDEAPVVPIWHYTYERLFQPWVRSVEVNGLGDPYIPLRRIWLERPGG